MSNGADSAAKHKLPPASESTPHFEVMECDLRALTTMDLQLCHFGDKTRPMSLVNLPVNLFYRWGRGFSFSMMKRLTKVFLPFDIWNTLCKDKKLNQKVIFCL